MAKNPVETKVKTSTWATLAASVLLANVNAVQDQPGILDPLPPWVQFMIIATIPPVATFLSGYAAPHTGRDNPPDTR